jgi:FlaA1/EpsC-like NDP-sugar epimerase
MQKIYRFFPFPIAVLAVLLGTLGFRLVSNETSFSTCLYQAAQLFTISSGAIQGKLPWSLELARWLAPMATLGAILLAARSFFYALLARFKSLAYHNHTILCGAGDRGLAIVCRIKTQGQQVVVIDTNDESVSANKIRSLGIPLFIGDGMDDKIIRIAGIKRAKRLIATCGSDEINLRIAGNLNGKTEAEIIAAVENPA